MNIIAAHRACGILYRFLKATTKGKGYLIPANVCHVVPMTFLAAGVPFTFIDINEKTLCADEAKCLELLGAGEYDGLLFVRTYGYVYDTDSFFRKVKNISSDISIIDDRCLCEPCGEWEGNQIADIVLYSTGYAEFVELKYGAYSFVSDEATYKKMLEEPDLHYDKEIDIDEFIKQRSDTVIREKLQGWLDTELMDQTERNEYLDKIASEKDAIKSQKIELNSQYDRFLYDYVINDSINGWRYNIRVSNKKEVLKTIFSNGLFASGHYRPLSSLFGQKVETPVADKLHKEVINLFNDHYFTKEQAGKICQIINQTAKK